MENAEAESAIPPDLEYYSDSSRSARTSVDNASEISPSCSFESVSQTSQVEVTANEQVDFTVQGLYTRKEVTTEQADSYEPEFLLSRRRMRTKPLHRKETPAHRDHGSHDDTYETALFEPGIGLVGAKFWHEYDDTAKVVREDRAILFQSQENYEVLMENEEFEWCFEESDYMEHPTFGEQVIVNGCKTSDLAVGDIFTIEGGHSSLVVEITSPRKPCNYVNLKHDTYMGEKGIQNYAHHNCLSGWFARVLVAGELREGMKFKRKSHPNPKWTLTYINKALYGEGNRLESLMNISTWKRGRAELEELVALPQLAEYEWKAEGRKNLLKLDGVDWKQIRNDWIDHQYDWEKRILEYPEDAKKALPPSLRANGVLELVWVASFLQLVTNVIKFFYENNFVTVLSKDKLRLKRKKS